MMQEDSNGESTFEFVEQKVEGNKEVSESPTAGTQQPTAPISIPTQTTAPPLSVVPLTSSPPQGNFLPSPMSQAAFSSGPASQLGTPPSPPPPPPPTAAIDFEGIVPSFPTTSSESQSPNGGSGRFLDWLGGGILSKVAAKAQNSVNSVITTLDPQMREFIYSGGDIDLVVASDKEVKISPVREGFQTVFGKATVRGVAAQASTIAAQPVGFVAGVKGAEERIQWLRTNNAVHEQQPVVAVENFLVEITQDRWYDMGVLVLSDPAHGIFLQTFTQPTPVPLNWVTSAQEGTPPDYPLRWAGLGVTIGEIAAKNLQVPHTEWHETLAGVSRREMVLIASRTLAGLYKSALRV